MSNQTTTKKSPLQSSNLWTNIGTIVVAVILAFLSPDLNASGQISGEVANVVSAIKAANYGLLITALFNLGNIIYHLFRK